MKARKSRNGSCGYFFALFGYFLKIFKKYFYARGLFSLSSGEKSIKMIGLKRFTVEGVRYD